MQKVDFGGDELLDKPGVLAVSLMRPRPAGCRREPECGLSPSYPLHELWSKLVLGQSGKLEAAGFVQPPSLRVA